MEFYACSALDPQSRYLRSVGSSPRRGITGGVAVEYIEGILTKSGEAGTSSQLAASHIRQHITDDSVSAVVLVIDSPGGQTAGTQDLANAVRDLAAVKPVAAVIEDLGASAAYWVASQANRIYATNDTTLVGSIGTYLITFDLSQAFERSGIKPVVISTGKYKAMAYPGTEITDEHKAQLQTVVDGIHATFATAVKMGRNMNDGQFSQVSDGRVFVAADAKRLGLIDGIVSVKDAISKLANAEELATV